MGIQVTPIPRLTSLTTPAFTLGTANAAGDALTAVASNSTLLAYDATLPDAITYGQSGSAGSASTSARRDHAHAMAAADTVSAASEAQQVAGSVTTGFTSPGRQQFHDSAAKAWCYINLDGTLRAGNYGVSSIEAPATGSRVVNFSTAFDAGDEYTAMIVLNNGQGYIQYSHFNADAQAFLTKNTSGTNTNFITQVLYFGEQA